MEMRREKLHCRGWEEGGRARSWCQSRGSRVLPGGRSRQEAVARERPSPGLGKGENPACSAQHASWEADRSHRHPGGHGGRGGSRKT